MRSRTVERLARIGTTTAVVLLSACSAGAPGASTTSSSSSTAVVVKTEPALPVEIQMVGYLYIPADLRVKAGRAVFYLVNPSSETYAHNMVIADQAGDELARSPSVSPGTTALFTVNRLSPGVYTFSSTLEGIGYSADGTQGSHGMVGRLTVVLDYDANSRTMSAVSPPPGSIRVVMADQRFAPSDIQVRTGPLVFFLVSPDTETLPHNMTITDPSGRVVATSNPVVPGRSAVFTVEYLPPGPYEFSSTLGGPDDPTQHYQSDAGMVGSLIVSG